ncbi:MAG: hypothetical protein JSS96_01320 [Bacteroidetes bacterium]|nr:hypothetical protein [Bacteroidota bacterium]
MKKLFLLATFLLAIIFETFAQKTYIDSLPDGSGAYYVLGKVSAKHHSVKCDCNYVQALLIQQAMPGKIKAFQQNAIKFWGANKGYEHYKESKYVVQVACKERLMRTISATDYNDAGKTLFSKERSGDDIEWMHVKTDLSGKEVVDCVCKLIGKNSN